MSLINDMLRDLEKRRRSDPVTAVQARIAHGSGEGRKKYFLFGSGILVLLLAGGLVASGSFSRQPAIIGKPALTKDESMVKLVVPSPQAPLVVAPNDQAENATAQPVPAAVAAPAGAAKTMVDQAAETTEMTAVAIQARPDRAELELSFSTPAAYELLQSESDTRRLVLSFKQVELGSGVRIPAAEQDQLIKQVSLQPQADGLHLLIDFRVAAALQSIRTTSDDGNRWHLLIAFTALPADVAKPAAQKTVPVAQQVKPRTETPVAVSKPVAEVPAVQTKVNKTANRLGSDRQLYQAGLKSLEAGDSTTAAKNFEQALALNPGLVAARLRLISILQQRQEQAAAEMQLRQGLQATPENVVLRKTYARLLLSGKRYTEAIALLEQAPRPLIQEDQEYFALLAAIFQESGHFADAARLYRELVNIRPQNALWWFGLGLAADQDGDGSMAQKAYQAALALPGLRPDLQVYVRNRLQVL